MADYTFTQTSALLLQGGGLRGCYTSGALDALMEREIYFPTVAGVSAGALNAVNYLARQPGRSAQINLSYRHDPRYAGPLAMLQSRSVFGLDFILDKVKVEVPFDQKTYDESPQRFIAVATNLATGSAEYFEKAHCPEMMKAVTASASMPLVSLPVTIGGQRYLDGGCDCPVPLYWAKSQWFQKIVVISTQHRGYRKPMPSQTMIDRYHDFYSGSPRFFDTLLTMDVHYNSLMDEMDMLHDAGKIFVLYPSAPITIDRMEGDTDKLLALVNQGRRDLFAALDEMKAYLER